MIGIGISNDVVVQPEHCLDFRIDLGDRFRGLRAELLRGDLFGAHEFSQGDCIVLIPFLPAHRQTG